MRTLAEMSSAEGTLAIPRESCGDGGPCVINKDHGTLQKFYMGEEGNQKHLGELCVIAVESSRKTQCRTGGGGGGGDWRS